MFAIQQTGAASSGSISASNLADVQATGDLEVTYTLSAGNSAFLSFLGTAGLRWRVFEPAAAAADPDGFSNEPVGTGAFMIESRDLDNATVVVRNDSWWNVDPDGNQLPYLDSITFRPIPDETTRLDSLLSGTVNVMQTLRQGTIRDALRGGQHRSPAVPGQQHRRWHVQQRGCRHTTTFVSDSGLVQLNPQDRVIEALGGTGISLPATQWFSPDSPWYSQKVADAWPKFDFDAGVALPPGVHRRSELVPTARPSARRSTSSCRARRTPP